MRGLGEKEVTRLLFKAVEDVGEKCLPILEGIAASIEELDETQQSMAVEMINDWNFLASVNPTYICSRHSSAADQAWQIPDVQSVTGLRRYRYLYGKRLKDPITSGLQVITQGCRCQSVTPQEVSPFLITNSVLRAREACKKEEFVV
jgi:hypothetical protein